MPGNYTLRKTYVDGDILSASDYVADHQQHIDNQTPQGTDDYSANVTQMRTLTDTGSVNSESLATSLAGELERIRFVLKDIKTKMNGSAVLQWYDKSYAVVIPNGSVTAAKLANGATFIQYLQGTSSGSGAITTPSNIVVLPITMTRSRVRIKGFINLQLVAATANVTITLSRNGSTIATYPDFVVASDTGVDIDFVDAPGAGTYTYALVAEKTAGAGALNKVAASLSLEEIA